MYTSFTFNEYNNKVSMYALESYVYTLNGTISFFEFPYEYKFNKERSVGLDFPSPIPQKAFK